MPLPSGLGLSFNIILSFSLAISRLLSLGTQVVLRQELKPSLLALALALAFAGLQPVAHHLLHCVLGLSI
ncbi:hypothetical protein HaLaN_08711 [Haematococcus lacustris]|uniref:Uncharacterized protein n=1 Tax=Haematococcus lacustris TaxID=44745 RepID=A0A699Z1Q1_HAELA|nr:hypothetical protein HaLaN_08711 [Haematococcus lacustris]